MNALLRRMSEVEKAINSLQSDVNELGETLSELKDPDVAKAYTVYWLRLIYLLTELALHSGDKYCEKVAPSMRVPAPLRRYH